MKINTSGKLHIGGRTVPQYLTMFIFIMPFLLSFLTTFLGLPSILKYTIDVAWVFIVVIALCKSHITFNRQLYPMVLLVGAFALYTLVVYLFNYQSIIYYLWGFRNNFRFYVAFFAFAILFTEDDVDGCFKLLDVIFWIDVVVSLYQFFVLGLSWDYLGGIFGTDTGCNASTLIFFTIIVSRSVLQYMNHQENIFYCIAKCATALIVGAMAELKFFSIIFVLIMLMATLLTSFTWRKFAIIMIAGVLIVFSGSLLTAFFGESSQLSLEKIIEIVTKDNYSSQNDLSRFSAVSTISETILVEPYQKLFGLGLGNCDTSSFAICNTPFYLSHGYLHYTWFSSSFMFLETGYLGLTIYMSFFVLNLISAIKTLRRQDKNKLYSQMAIIMSIVCMILVFYNSSLRTETAYIAYFIMALPYVCAKTQKKER